MPRWLRPRLFASCPGCGGDSRDHDVCTLARERFCSASETSGVEAALAAGDFEKAAALDEPNAWGDLLTHQLVQCGGETLLVTVEDVLAFEPRIRRVSRVDLPKLGGKKR